MRNKGKIRVRFHLGSGKHYKHWKIEYPNGEDVFLNPDGVNMVLYNCKLHNYKRVSKKIYDGGTKVVCAWIYCDSVKMELLNTIGDSVSYNPKVTPNWVFRGKDADGFEFNRLQIINNKVISLS